MYRALRPGGQFAGRVLGDEIFEALVAEVFEDSLLALFPGFVQGAGGIFAAGSVFHDAAGDSEGTFGRLYGVSEGYLLGAAGKAGASSAALLALDQTRVREPSEDAGQQTARDVGFGGDPVGRRPLSQPGEVDQGP